MRGGDEMWSWWFDAYAYHPPNISYNKESANTFFLLLKVEKEERRRLETKILLPAVAPLDLLIFSRTRDGSPQLNWRSLHALLSFLRPIRFSCHVEERRGGVWYERQEQNRMHQRSRERLSSGLRNYNRLYLLLSSCLHSVSLLSFLLEATQAEWMQSSKRGGDAHTKKREKNLRKTSEEVEDASNDSLYLRPGCCIVRSFHGFFNRSRMCVWVSFATCVCVYVSVRAVNAWISNRDNFFPSSSFSSSSVSSLTPCRVPKDLSSHLAARLWPLVVIPCVVKLKPAN